MQEKKIQEILETEPDLLEREMALFFRRAGNYLFKKRTNMWEIIERFSFLLLGLALVARWLGWR